MDREPSRATTRCARIGFDICRHARAIGTVVDRSVRHASTLIDSVPAGSDRCYNIQSIHATASGERPPDDQQLIALIIDALGAKWSAGELPSLLAEVG